MSRKYRDSIESVAPSTSGAAVDSAPELSSASNASSAGAGSELFPERTLTDDSTISSEESSDSTAAWFGLLRGAGATAEDRDVADFPAAGRFSLVMGAVLASDTRLSSGLSPSKLRALSGDCT